MPSLYGTGTSYTVTASSLISLYQVSTSTAVITATTYSTNLVGLYGGSYAALPTNAEQLIQLFDNSGNVHFFLDPATNSATIYATVNLSTGTISIGNYAFNGNTVTNLVDGPIDLNTNGLDWTFNTDGSTSFPNYTFPSGHGTAGQVLIDDGSGNLYWDTIEGGVTDLTAGTGIALSSNTGSITITNIGVTNITGTNAIAVSANTGSVTLTNLGVTQLTGSNAIAVSANTGSVTLTNLGVTQLTGSNAIAVSTSTGSVTLTNLGVTALASDGSIAVSTSTGSVSIANMGVRAVTAGTGISVSTSTGTVSITNSGVTSITAGTSTYVSTSSGNIVIWTDPPATPLSTAYDFGTILAPVSYTLDMGPIIV